MDDLYLLQPQSAAVLDEILKHSGDLLGEVSVEVKGIGNDH